MKNLSFLFYILNIFTFSVSADVFEYFNDINSQSPGCAIGVVKKDKLVYERYFGQANLRYRVPIDEKTVFNLGSITKHFTAALVLQSEIKGELSLNDSLKKYYPQGPSWFSDIKLHHLINHQSGIPDYLNDDNTRGQLAKKLSTIPYLLEKLVVGKPITRDVTLSNVLELMFELPTASFKAGEKASYSNTGYLFLADILEKSSRISLNELTQKQIFTPLGMYSTELASLNSIEIPWSATGYDVVNASKYEYRRSSSNLITQGDGGLLSTLSDFSKWISYLINTDAYELFKGSFKPMKPALNLWGTGYINGLSINHVKGEVVYSHGGLSTDSMRSYFWVSPVHKIGYVQLCNFNFNKRPTISEIIEVYGA